jgi:hypothetical protein
VVTGLHNDENKDRYFELHRGRCKIINYFGGRLEKNINSLIPETKKHCYE